VDGSSRRDLIVRGHGGNVNDMTNISSGAEFRLELHRRIKDSLMAGMADAGVTPQEIAEQEGDMIDLATIIVEDIGLEVIETPDGPVARFRS